MTNRWTWFLSERYSVDWLALLVLRAGWRLFCGWEKWDEMRVFILVEIVLRFPFCWSFSLHQSNAAEPSKGCQLVRWVRSWDGNIEPPFAPALRCHSCRSDRRSVVGRMMVRWWWRRCGSTFCWSFAGLRRAWRRRGVHAWCCDFRVAIIGTTLR